MKRLLLILSVFFLFGCNSEEQIPEHILQPEQIRPVLVDLMYHQELLRMQAMNKDSAAAVFQEVFRPEILQNHGVERAHFDSSYNYYLADVERFDDMWMGVVDTLSLRVQLAEAKAKGDTLTK